jgi:hypothetical protein
MFLDLMMFPPVPHQRPLHPLGTGPPFTDPLLFTAPPFPFPFPLPLSFTHLLAFL